MHSFRRVLSPWFTSASLVATVSLGGLNARADGPSRAIVPAAHNERTDAVIRMPAPMDSGKPAPTSVMKAESVPPPALPDTIEPVELGVLDRPMFVLTLDGAPDPDVAEQFANLDERFSITDSSEERFGSWDAPVADAAYAPPRFAPVAFHWAAPAVFSRPLYFEQPNLERYGHYPALYRGDLLTPSAISAAHFFATIPALPYQLGAEPPDECNYVLGSFRPGSCNPHQLIRPKLSLRGLAYEAVVATGLVFMIP